MSDSPNDSGSNSNGRHPTKDPILFLNRRKRPRPAKPGSIKFDELGNAQYQWVDTEMLEESETGEARRLRSLQLANLVLVDDDQPHDPTIVRLNKHGLRMGYNPYDSGRLEKSQITRRPSLHELSKWMASRKSPPQTEE